MTTCKECLFEEICVALGRHYNDNNQNPVEELCRHFKNKANFVEVVKCRDCKHYKLHKSFSGKEKMYCDELTYDELIYVEPDGFCNYGERRNA